MSSTALTLPHSCPQLCFGNLWCCCLPDRPGCCHQTAAYILPALHLLVSEQAGQAALRIVMLMLCAACVAKGVVLCVEFLHVVGRS
jgi:hypothetical protein